MSGWLNIWRKSASVYFPLVLTFLFSYLPQSGFSQETTFYSTSAEQKFATALWLYDRSQFDSAAILFLDLSNTPGHHRQSAALIMAAKSLFRAGKYAQARAELDRFSAKGGLFQRRHGAGWSSFTADAYFTRALIDAAEDKVVSSILNLDSAQSFSPARKLANDIDSLTWFISHRLVQEMQVDSILSAVSGLQNQRVRSIVSVQFGSALLSRGDLQRARDIVSGIERDALPSWLRTIHDTIEQELATAKVVKVGVLLPLRASEEFVSRAAQELLEGIRLAVELARGCCDSNPIGNSGKEKQKELLSAPHHSALGATWFIDLDVRDTRHDGNRAVNEMGKLAADSAVIFVLGPMFSDEVRSVASVASSAGLALISPTANEPSLASYGKTVFLMNPDDQIKIEALVQFAVRDLHDSVFAALAPDVMNERAAAQRSEIGVPNLTDRVSIFTKSVVKAGGRVVATERYDPTNGDLSQQFRSLEASQKQSPIQALYVPVSTSDEIEIVVSQLAYHGWKVQLLGSDEWNNLSALYAQRKYAAGVVFPSDSYLADSAELNHLQKLYEERTRKVLSRFVLYGYDTMKAALKALSNSDGTRSGFLLALQKLPHVKGVHNDICFLGTQVNHSVQILQFTGEDIVRLVPWIVGGMHGSETKR
ncbi:MAG: ABC transporter substrate-binding protein [Bacteroidota bacterium]